MRWWERLNDSLLSDWGLAILAAVVGVVLTVLVIGVLKGCAATHGGHWWCWL